MKTKTNKQAYFVGGGIASLSGAAYLIRDCGFKGEDIHILESMNILGGSNDGIGTPKGGFVCRGGRMLNEETYENFWELFRSIPSLSLKNKSVTEEILEFDHSHPTNAQARLIDKNGVIQDVGSMGFNTKDRLTLAKLMKTDEKKLDDLKISDWFEKTPHFFTTNFWNMWQTTFAFQRWSSLLEFKRYMNRMMFEFSRIQTLEGVTRTTLNQYDSVILPLKVHLENKKVDFSMKCTVTDLDFKKGDGITVTGIHYTKDNKNDLLSLNEEDICIVTNGFMTDRATLGSLKAPAVMSQEKPISGELWRKIANKKSGLGNPAPFFGDKEKTNWESFTITMKGKKLLDKIEKFSNNVPGSGALMTFKDSSWRLSIVVAAQPHFIGQTKNETIFWGYGLYTNNIGDYIKKPMRDCTGEELLLETLYHLKFINQKDEIMKDVINVIPCMMPYIISMFQPRKMSDRPAVVPKGSTNFAMISQYVEIKDDMVFTEEYSVRAARTAVYTLLNIDKEICPVTPFNKQFPVIKNAIKTAYRKKVK